MNDKNKFKTMNINEQQSELLVLRKNQFNLRMKKANGSLDKFHLIAKVRKDIARIKTRLTEKGGVKL